MPRINLKRVMNSPRLNQSVTVYRQEGEWVAGRWVKTPVTISMKAIVTIASPEELAQVPEGDRITGALCFHTSQRVYDTSITTGVTSDEIEWDGKRYRLFNVTPWKDFGYYKATGVFKGGA